MAERLDTAGIIDFTPEKLQTVNGVNELNRILKLLVENLASDGVNMRQYYGYGTPEGNISAQVGSTYQRLDGGAGTTLYVKESGSGDTGWAGV